MFRLKNRTWLAIDPTTQVQGSTFFVYKGIRNDFFSFSLHTSLFIIKIPKNFRVQLSSNKPMNFMYQFDVFRVTYQYVVAVVVYIIYFPITFEEFC